MFYKDFGCNPYPPINIEIFSTPSLFSILKTPFQTMELHKPITRKFKRHKVYSSFKDNICGVDLADMQLISKYNKGIKFLLCVIDIFSKYAWVVPLKDKKGITIANAFQSILNNLERKPSTIWVDQGSEFYSKSFKIWLEDNNIKMHSTYNEGNLLLLKDLLGL